MTKGPSCLLLERQKPKEGCRIEARGEHLPLVKSDMHASGFRRAELAKDRSKVDVWLTAWGMDQRRFIERLVEHHTQA